MQLHQSFEVEKYLSDLPSDDKEKLVDLLRSLPEHNGNLPSGHTKYLRDKIWELKLESGKKNHRILYTVISKDLLVALTAFAKKTKKTPKAAIEKAVRFRKLFLQK